MKVILQQDVKKLGQKGDIVEVSEGYGRNFLLPRKAAILATAENLNVANAKKGSKERKDAMAADEAKLMAKQLEKVEVTIPVQIGEGGKLFGSVTAAQVADAVNAKYKAGIDKKDVKLDDAIKQAGTYPFRIRLCTGVEAEMSLKVETE